MNPSAEYLSGYLENNGEILYISTSIAVDIASIHRVKGLEFQYIFIVVANKRKVPLASAIDHTDAISEQESITAEKFYFTLR
ncbi:MAG: hypothetical protein GX157_08450 [Candidatus Cloacimonetes bacterium]|nr:hypothetical protein [Candidatus Cloacimonadota bacterium]